MNFPECLSSEINNLHYFSCTNENNNCPENYADTLFFLNKYEFLIKKEFDGVADRQTNKSPDEFTVFESKSKLKTEFKGPKNYCR